MVGDIIAMFLSCITHIFLFTIVTITENITSSMDFSVKIDLDRLATMAYYTIRLQQCLPAVRQALHLVPDGDALELGAGADALLVAAYGLVALLIPAGAVQAVGVRQLEFESFLLVFSITDE